MSESEPDPFDSTRFARAVESFIEHFPGPDREGLTEWMEAHPGMAEVLRSTLGALDALGAASEGGAEREGVPATLGDYRLGPEIGRGGMGVVYEATQVSLGRRVALKVMPGARFVHEDQRQRFQREAGVASRLEHPAICTIHGYGVEEGIPYIAMSLVPGRTLSRIIDEGSGVVSDNESEATALDFDTPLEGASSDEDTIPLLRRPRPERAEVLRRIALIAEVSRAIHAAHEAGIVHRDIKPGNIMVTPEGRPVVLDFGLARDDAPGAVTLTRTGDIFGTPAYMAPEQLEPRGKNLDRRLDVHALGVTLFELLTGERPFEAPTRAALLQKIVNEPAPDARRLNAAIPRDAAVVVETALEKEPDRRYRTAQAFADDLERVLRHEPVRARPASAARRLRRWVQRQPALAALIALVFLAVPVVASFTTWYLATRDVLLTGEAERARQQTEALLQEGYNLLTERPPRAIAAFQRALAVSPDSVEALAGLAWSHFENGESQQALDVLDARPDQLKAAPALRVLRGNALRELGRSGEAEVISRELTAPSSSFDFFILGMSNLSPAVEGDQEVAKKAFDFFTQSILRSERPRATLHHQRLRAAGLTGDAQLVRSASNPVVHRWPDDPDTWFWIGRAAALAGDLDRGKFALSRAADMRPQDVRTRSYLADLLRQRGELEAAEAAARRAIEGDPDSVRARQALATILATNDDYEGATRAYLEALAIDPSRFSLRVDLAQVLIRQGQLDKAREQLQIVIESGDRSTRAGYVMAAILSSKGDVDGAIKTLREYLERRPRDAAAHRALGGTLFGRGDHEKGLHHLGRAAELDPDDAEFRSTYEAAQKAAREVRGR